MTPLKTCIEFTEFENAIVKIVSHNSKPYHHEVDFYWFYMVSKLGSTDFRQYSFCRSKLRNWSTPVSTCLFTPAS